MFYVIKPFNIFQNLKEVDQEIQRGPMSIFLIKYLLQTQGSKELISIFLINYLYKLTDKQNKIVRSRLSAPNVRKIKKKT